MIEITFTNENGDELDLIVNTKFQKTVVEAMNLSGWFVESDRFVDVG